MLASLLRLRRRLADRPCLDIQLRWGETLVAVAHLSPPRTFRIGGESEGPERCDLFVPPEVVGTSSLPVVLVGPGLALRVVVPMRATGWVDLPGQPTMNTEEAIARGILQPCPDVPQALQAWLHPGMRVRICLRRGRTIAPYRTDTLAESDALEVSVEWTEAMALLPLRAPTMPGWAPMSAMVGASIVHAMLLIWAGLSYPHLAPVEDELVEQPNLYLLQSSFPKLVDDSEDESVERDEQPAGPADCRSGGPCNGGPGAMGDPMVSSTGGAYGVAGPQDNPDPHIGRSYGEPPSFSFGFETRKMGVQPRSLIAPWGRDDSLGLDPIDALGKLKGQLMADSKGSKGLGGQGGRSAGVPREDSAAGTPICEAPAPAPEVYVGASAKATPLLDIRNLIQSQTYRFQHCFDSARQASPKLRGQVVVHALINSNGEVVSVDDGGSVGASDEVVDCFLQAFRSLALANGNSEPSEVLYPFRLGS